jgi:hypothetical protein
VLVLDAASDLTRQGRSPFKLSDLVAVVQQRDPGRARTTIQPVVQGMTANAGKGPASPCGTPLLRIGRGYYELASDHVSARPGAATAPTRSRRRTMISASELQRRVLLVVAEFDRYVQVYDDLVPFRRAGQYELHRRAIERRRELGSAVAAVMDDDFTADLHATLLAWGIGRRASRLVPLEVFRARLRAHHGVLGVFDGLVLEDVSIGQVGRVTLHVDRLIAQLGVVENKARIVAGTKTLHHILPDLVPPMDRAWTGAFFGWTDMDPQHNQSRIFSDAFQACAEIARAAHPSRLVGSGWRTSSTKLIDNALIGYCKTNSVGGGP